MAKTRASYEAEFRAGAVRIVTETGKTAAQVARDLGVHEATLQNWVSRAAPRPRPHRKDSTFRGD